MQHKIENRTRIAALSMWIQHIIYIYIYIAHVEIKDSGHNS